MVVPREAANCAEGARIVTGKELLISPAGICHEDGALTPPTGSMVMGTSTPGGGAGADIFIEHTVVSRFGRQLNCSNCGAEGTKVSVVDTLCWGLPV
jgi:hypothetical protein